MKTVKLKKPVYAIKKPPQAVAKRAERLTTEIIYSLLSSVCGSAENPKSMRLPTRNEVIWLFTEMLRIRQNVKIEKFFKDEHVQVVENEQSLAVVTEALEAQRDRFLVHLDTINDSIATHADDDNGDFAVQFVPALRKEAAEQTARIDLASRLLADLALAKQDRRFGFQPAHEPLFKEQWPLIILEIVLAYQRTMRPSNRQNDLAIHANGPGGKFVASIIPYLTAEAPTAAAVARRWRDISSDS